MPTKVLDLLHTLIGDVGQGKIKMSQIRIAGSDGEGRIADPGSAKHHSGDMRLVRSRVTEPPRSVIHCVSSSLRAIREEGGRTKQEQRAK